VKKWISSSPITKLSDIKFDLFDLFSVSFEAKVGWPSPDKMTYYWGQAAVNFSSGLVAIAN
jgi:hypothetical protein